MLELLGRLLYETGGGILKDEDGADLDKELDKYRAGRQARAMYANATLNLYFSKTKMFKS